MTLTSNFLNILLIPQYYHLLLGKTFSFTPDEAKVEDLAKASVTENNLFSYWENYTLVSWI